MCNRVLCVACRAGIRAFQGSALPDRADRQDDEDRDADPLGRGQSEPDPPGNVTTKEFNEKPSSRIGTEIKVQALALPVMMLLIEEHCNKQQDLKRRSQQLYGQVRDPVL